MDACLAGFREISAENQGATKTVTGALSPSLE